jgi:outer membrane immunogenic protein
MRFHFQKRSQTKRVVWRSMVRCQRLRTIRTLLIGLPLVAVSSNAVAQSSTGAAINAATGQSLADAVSQNEKELIDREVLGAAPAGRSGIGGAGAAGISSFPTGRLRTSDHDGLKPLTDTSFSYRTREASVFGNIVYSVPETVWGGQLKLTGFVGQNQVSLDLKSNGIAILDPNQSGSASNASLIVGGTALWSQKNTYALATLVGTWGQTTLKDSVDDCYQGPPPACNHNRYNFNTTGFIGTVTAGQVFDLGNASAPKLDVRGSVRYTHNDGDRFSNVFGDQQKYWFSSWAGTVGATLFANMSLENNALLRPYIQGYVRQEWGYRSGFDFTLVGQPADTNRQDQAHLYGGVDAGLTYAIGNMTYGAAIYYEASGDERTLGGRVGMSVKLDDALKTERDKRLVLKAAQDKGPLSWSGFYVGLNAGSVWGDARTNTSVACLDTSDVTVAPFINHIDCPFPSSGESAAVGAAGSGKLSDRSFTGGGQAGVNVQAGRLVYGLEVDVQSLKLRGARTGTANDPVNLGNVITVGTAFDTDWLFTARSRFGWTVAPNFLLYGTGGVAATELGARNSISSSVTGAQGAASHTSRVTGWTLGGGAEWALNRNWTLRAEYLYLDFGNVTTNASVSDGTASFPSNLATTVNLTARIARAGVNYKF